MEKWDWVGGLIGIVFGALLFFVPYITKSKNQQILIVVGIITSIFLIIVIFAVSRKFKEINEFTDNQEKLNKKFEDKFKDQDDKFKIYERLANLEARLNLLEKNKK